MRETVTRSELADRLGVSRPYITKLGAKGLLVEATDGRLDLAATLELIEAHGDPRDHSERKNEISRERAEARLRYEVAKADREEIELQKLRGELVPAVELERLALHNASLLRALIEETSQRLPEVAEALRNLQAELAERAELLAEEPG